ncbi:transposase, partial [Shigella flexneri]
LSSGEYLPGSLQGKISSDGCLKKEQMVVSAIASTPQCDVIVQAPLPPKPIERGYASAGLLARILVSKYMEHIPLYRQSEIYARQGVELSRNTMVRWVSEMADKLRPLYIALNDYVLEAGKVHADDTPVKVLAPGNGKTKTGRLWVYVRDDRNAGSSLPAAV